jgi:hypothetical protein
MNAISKRYARINIQIEQIDSSEERIQSWVTMLDDAVNWSTSSDYTIFYASNFNLIGVSLPVGNTDMELLEVGTVLGNIKAEITLSELEFENLWFSIQEEDTDVIAGSS